MVECEPQAAARPEGWSQSRRLAGLWGELDLAGKNVVDCRCFLKGGVYMADKYNELRKQQLLPPDERKAF